LLSIFALLPIDSYGDNGLDKKIREIRDRRDDIRDINSTSYFIFWRSLADGYLIWRNIRHCCSGDSILVE
jgi:hypothetical protein